MSVVASDSGWILDRGVMDTRFLDTREEVRWEWGEAFWTARIIAEGEVAYRELVILGRGPRGCF